MTKIKFLLISLFLCCASAVAEVENEKALLEFIRTSDLLMPKAYLLNQEILRAQGFIEGTRQIEMRYQGEDKTLLTCDSHDGGYSDDESTPCQAVIYKFSTPFRRDRETRLLTIEIAIDFPKGKTPVIVPIRSAVVFKN